MHIGYLHIYFWRNTYLLFLFFNLLFTTTIQASLIAQFIKNLPAMLKILVQFLGQEDLLEKG